MKIVILNGNPAASNRNFDSYLGGMNTQLTEAGHDVTAFTLRDMEIRQCVGCFGCWVKTPGICALKDEHEGILRAYVEGDMVVFASPLVMGFTSALLKKATDRIVPILLPYIDGSSGECRHFQRYEKQPLIALLYEPENDTDNEDLDVIAAMWRRLARNAKSQLAFFSSSAVPAREVCHEITGM